MKIVTIEEKFSANGKIKQRTCTKIEWQQEDNLQKIETISKTNLIVKIIKWIITIMSLIF